MKYIKIFCYLYIQDRHGTRDEKNHHEMEYASITVPCIERETVFLQMLIFVFLAYDRHEN